MAGRILNRRELREQAERALGSSPESTETVSPDAGSAGLETPAEAPAGKPAKKAAKAKKARATPRAKAVRKVKAPPRMVARWGIFDASMKRVAIFDYSERAAADARLARLLQEKKGTHFLQMVKEPMPEAAAETPGAAPAGGV